MILSVCTRNDDKAESEQVCRNQSVFDIGLYVRKDRKRANKLLKARKRKCKLFYKGSEN